MKDDFRRKMDKIDREEVFFTDNAADFASHTKAQELNGLINAEKAIILAFDAQQTSGFDEKRQAQEIYENRRDTLVDYLEEWVLAAGIVDDDIEGTAEAYKMPRPRTDQNLIAKATAFAANGASIKAEFIAAGLSNEAFDNLLTARDAFQQAALAHDSAEEKHAEGTGGMIASFRKIMNWSRLRGKIAKLKYRNNAAKLAAFTVASHLDRAPKKKPPTP